MKNMQFHFIFVVLIFGYGTWTSTSLPFGGVCVVCVCVLCMCMTRARDDRKLQTPYEPNVQSTPNQRRCARAPHVLVFCVVNHNHTHTHVPPSHYLSLSLNGDAINLFYSLHSHTQLTHSD